MDPSDRLDYDDDDFYAHDPHEGFGPIAWGIALVLAAFVAYLAWQAFT